MLNILKNNIIYGTYKVSLDSIKLALSSGFKILDTATGYNNVHIINQAIKETNITPIIMTKYNPNDFFNIQTSIMKHNTDLGKIPDIILLHSPFRSPKENVTAFNVLRKYYPQQIIGVSNFSINQIKDMMNEKCKIDIISIEFSPFYQPNKLIEFCENNHIFITGYRLLSTGKVFQSDVLKKIANDNQSNVTEILINWSKNKNITPILSTSKKENMNNIINYKTLSIDTVIIIDTMNLEEKGSTCMLKYCDHDKNNNGQIDE